MGGILHKNTTGEIQGVLEAEIYSVNNESWTTIGDFPTVALNIKGQGVLLNGTLTDVWIMREYGVHESWEKIFTFNRPSGPTCYEFSSLLCRSVTSEILFLFGSAFVIFDPRDDSIRHRHVFHHHILSDASIYIESLVWPFLSEDSWTQQIQQIPDSFIYESWCPSLARKSS
ncbi:hypothetical protein DM860_017619 [Cuscuta australis]|uniref:F-box associated domain-containing protein n=1 Tax=Cuscuta australis TaxID=267555 RepID=A0A328EAV5_9ASTE|nr:hypothetical protein DM860_017619 [Cuscuta australis]